MIGRPSKHKERTGKYRIKYHSSCGGHNGIRSIINALNTESIPRLKIGISKIKDIETKDYVLGHFNKDELSVMNANMPIFKNIITDFVNINIDDLMMKYNKK